MVLIEFAIVYDTFENWFENTITDCVDGKDFF